MALYPFFSAIQTDQGTSTGTANVVTMSPPSGAKGCFVTVSTNACYMVFTAAETPSATDGLALVKDAAPVYFPVGCPLIFASQAAGNSVVNVLWIK